MEVDDNRCRSNILVGGEVNNLVRHWNPQQRRGIGVQGNIRPKAKEIFGIQFGTIECSCCVHTAFYLVCQWLVTTSSRQIIQTKYLWGQKCRVDPLRLPNVLWVKNVVEDRGLHVPEVVEMEPSSNRTIS